MTKTKLFFNLTLLVLSFLIITVCNSKEPNESVISKNDYKKLIEVSNEEAYLNTLKSDGNPITINPERHFVSISKINFTETKKDIVANGGKIIFSDKLTGYIHFKATATKTLKLVEENAFKVLIVDKPLQTKEYRYKKSSLRDEANEIILGDLSSAKLMKATELKEFFKKQYGVDLNCSTSTVAVFDTGIDISRTDIFQDRIIHMRSIRTNDIALVTNAKEEVVDGVTYLTATLQGITTQIEKSEKLKNGTDFYLGFIAEKLLKAPRAGYDNYDLNQDGKDTGIFPIVVYKNEEGRFEAYINVNSDLTYGELGDKSIEDENKLADFNWVAANVKDRYVENADPSKSYYKYTTKMDIIGNEGLTSDRTKGLMNLAITLEAGSELTPDGKDLALFQEAPNGEKFYRVGIAGYDVNGHGTHVTGIAAGNFQTSPEYSSACTEAKIVNVANIGTSQHSNFYDEIIKLSKRYKNIVFNFSFGSSSPINDIQGPESELMDMIAKTYNIPFVKAAGNEGPGLKSHCVTISKYTISVANYMSTNSRQFFGYGSFPNNLYWPETSSSRGPMHDGAIKPDIGAPGWVLSSVPLAKPMGSNAHGSFRYYPGTSMASPNAASIVALLFDALEKSGLSKYAINSDENYQAGNLDKIRKALLNSAIPYDTFTYKTCSSNYGTSFSDWCQAKEGEFKFGWIEGGAGRINAMGAWSILEKISPERPIYYNTQTKSRIPGYHKDAIGYFNIGGIDSQITFSVKMDIGNSPSELTRHERLVLTIPEDIDWLSFNRIRVQKEKVIDVFGGEKSNVKLFILKEKLIENGRLKPGLHQTVIKGANIDRPEIFDMVFPVTIIGYHTSFDGLNENYQFGANGFSPSTMFQRYFIPVDGSNSSTILNLVTSPSMPGDLSMHVFHQGIEMPLESLGSTTPWALSTSDYGEGRNNLKFVLSGEKKGLYEVILTADTVSTYLFKNIPGAYYQFNAAKMSLDFEKVALEKMDSAQYIMLQNGSNPGSALRIVEATLKLNMLKYESSIVVKDKDSAIIPIVVPEGVMGILVETFYYGLTPKTDIDISIVSLFGQPIGQSAGPDSNEKILTQISPGSYMLQITGFSIPAGTEEFGYKISYILSDPITLVSEFKGATPSLTLKPGFRWNPNKQYSFRAKYDQSTVPNLPIIAGAKPVYTFMVRAQYDNNGKSTPVFTKILK